MNAVLGDLHRDRLARRRFAETTFVVRGGNEGGEPPPRIKIREKHGECLGASLWESGGILTHFLHSYLPRLSAEQERFRVLELGCGVGLPGIYCALKGCEVTLTDQHEVLGVARENVDANGLTGKVQVSELKWGHPLSPCTQGTYDLVIAADVLYREDHLSPLFQTLLQLTHPGSEVLIAYKQRIKSDAAFFEMASCHFEISTVWKQPDGDRKRSTSSIMQEHGHLEEGNGMESGKSVTGDWVSGATPCILRFYRRSASAQHTHKAPAQVCALQRGPGDE